MLRVAPTNSIRFYDGMSLVFFFSLISSQETLWDGPNVGWEDWICFLFALGHSELVRMKVYNEHNVYASMPVQRTVHKITFLILYLSVAQYLCN